MQLPFIIRHWAFAVGILLLGNLRAQTPAPGPTPDITVQFRIYAWGAKLPALAYGQGKVVESTEDGSMSPIQTYSGPPLLAFTHVPRSAHLREPLPVVASILIPKDARKVTLLTAPDGHGRYVMYPIPGDASALPAAHALLHNVSNKRLLVYSNGARQIQMEPGSSALVAGAGKGLVIQVAAQENTRWAALFNNVIPLNQSEGVNVLFIGGQNGSGIGMFVIPGWPAKPSATN